MTLSTTILVGNLYTVAIVAVSVIWIERNGRIKSLQELNDKLVLTNQLLSEDCNQLQEQVSAYELNQDSMQLQGIELQEQLGELYKCIQAGCGKVR